MAELPTVSASHESNLKRRDSERRAIDLWWSFARENLQPAGQERDASPPDTLHDELDTFLNELDDFLTIQAPEWPPEPPPVPGRSPDGSPRAQARDSLAALLEGVDLSNDFVHLHTSADLARLDGDATWLLCRALAATQKVDVAEHGTLATLHLATLLRRAVASSDPEVAVQAARAIAVLRVSEAQEAVAQRLLQGLAELGRERVEHLLDCLEAIGDGRCVRTMEAVLHRHSLALDDHHAWRARHIIQVIRRAGRR